MKSFSDVDGHEECILNYKKNKMSLPLYDIYNRDVNFNGVRRNTAGITVITPKQTISSFLNEETYVHEDTIFPINDLLYNFPSHSSIKNQNIEIRYSMDNNSNQMIILLFVPVPINVSQKNELELLNNQIKKIREEKGLKCWIEYRISPGCPMYSEYNTVYSKRNENLATLLDQVLINNNSVPKYSDEYLIGKVNEGLLKEEELNFSNDEIKFLLYNWVLENVNIFETNERQLEEYYSSGGNDVFLITSVNELKEDINKFIKSFSYYQALIDNDIFYNNIILKLEKLNNNLDSFSADDMEQENSTVPISEEMQEFEREKARIVNARYSEEDRQRLIKELEQEYSGFTGDGRSR